MLDAGPRGQRQPYGSHETRQSPSSMRGRWQGITYLVHVSPNDIYTWAQGPQVGTHLIRTKVSLPSTKKEQSARRKKHKGVAQRMQGTGATPCERRRNSIPRTTSTSPPPRPRRYQTGPPTAYTQTAWCPTSPPKHNELPQNTPYTTRCGCGQPRGATGTVRAGTAPCEGLWCRKKKKRAATIRQAKPHTQTGGEGNKAYARRRQPRGPHTRHQQKGKSKQTGTTMGRVGPWQNHPRTQRETTTRRTMKVANDQDKLRKRTAAEKTKKKRGTEKKKAQERGRRGSRPAAQTEALGTAGVSFLQFGGKVYTQPEKKAK